MRKLNGLTAAEQLAKKHLDSRVRGKNGGVRRNGWPDFAFRDKCSDRTLLVEVKGANDHISNAQSEMHPFLMDSYVTVYTCRVDVDGWEEKLDAAIAEHMHTADRCTFCGGRDCCLRKSSDGLAAFCVNCARDLLKYASNHPEEWTGYVDEGLARKLHGISYELGQISRGLKP